MIHNSRREERGEKQRDNLGCSTVITKASVNLIPSSEAPLAHCGCPRLGQGAMRLNEITWSVNYRYEVEGLSSRELQCLYPHINESLHRDCSGKGTWTWLSSTKAIPKKSDSWQLSACDSPSTQSVKSFTSKGEAAQCIVCLVHHRQSFSFLYPLFIIYQENVGVAFSIHLESDHF